MDTRKRAKVDYKDLLSPEDFSVFVKLREWCKSVASQESVPVYVIFTNDQLVQIAEKRITTLADLEKIEGVGETRVDKYGKDVISFRKNFDFNIKKLQDELVRHEPDIGHYRFFKVFDPKLRSICAASFAERVLHHAVMNICEPFLEAYAIHDSYVCRKGKGNRKALARAQDFSRSFDWYLKLDIRKYFDSIDHAILSEQLARRFKDRDLLQLFQALLETYHTLPGKGMPIFVQISSNVLGFPLEARTGLYAAARGTTMPRTAGRRTATGKTPTIGTTTTGSGLSAFQLTGPGGCRPADQEEILSPFLSGAKTDAPCRGW